MTIPLRHPEAPLFQHRYLALADRIEQACAVARWRRGDVDIWPMARMDLYLDMFRAEGRETAPKQSGAAERVARRLATPLSNLWRSRRDLEHWVGWPSRAHAIALGDGVTLDRIDGAWQDRYAEPLIAALEARGLATFLMQGGEMSRLPWARPTFAANLVSLWGELVGTVPVDAPVELPDHAEARRILDDAGVAAPSLRPEALARRARETAAAAWAFEQVLRGVRPRLAFVVTYYAGLGHAFALACRRQGVLCVDLQHCPQEGAHKAYRWAGAPETGYTTLPAVFWTWSEADAADICDWTCKLAAPWHSSFHGGHLQLGPFLDDEDPRTRAWDEAFAAVGDGRAWEREILVALQPIAGRRARWDALAEQIEAGPTDWRWWIRRHPATAAYQDVEYAGLLSLERPNVLVEAASALPLPALLRQMSATVSLNSGSAAEAAAFGVPAFFIDPEAQGQFARLVERGAAAVIDPGEVLERVARVPRRPVRPTSPQRLDLQSLLFRLEDMAEDYRRLRRGTAGVTPSA